jgi:hypothetical protein
MLSTVAESSSYIISYSAVMNDPFCYLKVPFIVCFQEATRQYQKRLACDSEY